MLNESEGVKKCQWRWIPGYFGIYLWCNDPEFRLSKGGGGVVVAKLMEVRNKGKRSAERLVLLKKVQRGNTSAYWIGKKEIRSENGTLVKGQWMTDRQIRDLAAAEGLDGYGGPEGVILESVVDPDGATAAQRVGSNGAVRVVDGGRVGERGDVVPVVDRGSAGGRDANGSWQLIDGSSESLRCRVVGRDGDKRFGDVEVKSSSGEWREVLPDAPGSDGRYVFSVPKVKEVVKGDVGVACYYWDTKQMTFEEILKGLR